ncbi:MAG: RagB/SusD family nutrient uptake outer membrane protein [Dysgonamonadaceae bacterium]|jgi:hypothetical protein|nr:RagB/SusD family nutrient uptake outer membrane protein [Dysgonamonadaceae bacterium]
MKIKAILIFAAAVILISCHDDLLNQPSRDELSSSEFWETTADAQYALDGAIADIRYLFSRDYYLDAMGEYVNVRGCYFQGTASNENASTALQRGAAYDGFYELWPFGYGYTFSNMYRYCYGGINRCNYVIDGLQKMLEKEDAEINIKQLEAFIGEAKLYRSLIYLRLISMWGDVPYIDERMYKKEEAESLSRTPIKDIVPELLADLQYAAGKLPDRTTQTGRMAKPAALALRGKVNLYWASWNKFGWEELEGFEPSEQAAQAAYTEAAADFRSVINDFGLTLFRGGAAGECDGSGKAGKLPNYYDLFLPAANGNPEFLLYFNFAGTGSSQSEELMRDFAGRSIAYSQGWLNPRFALANRYQSTITGDFCEPLIQMTPAAGGRTATNSALNPASYENRDYRMKATMLWDFEKIAGISSDGRTSTGWIPFIYKTDAAPNYEIDGELYTTYESGGCMTGYVFRKYIRNYPGQARSEGDFNWPVIRLADVYLMYAEAVNFANLAGQKDYAVEMVNRVRQRGNLPDLNGAKTAAQDDFFAAINQERIVELIAEGHRSFDIRRWRKIEAVFCPPFDPDGYKNNDTWDNPVSGFSSNGVFFQNQSNLSYQRCYIFAIPESERNKNPNLTQNVPFR